MKIEFCRCGGALTPAGKIMRCRSCGAEIKGKAELIKTESEKKEIIIIEDNRPDLPTTERQCPRCSCDRAYWWLIQTRSADEPPTQFFRCVECKHTWREYK